MGAPNSDSVIVMVDHFILDINEFSYSLPPEFSTALSFSDLGFGAEKIVSVLFSVRDNGIPIPLY